MGASDNKKRTAAQSETKQKTSKDFDFFRTVSILQDLDDKQLHRVYRIADRKKIASGTVIMKEGEPGDSMYLFFSGEVEVLNTLTMKMGKGDFAETEKSMVRLNAEVVSFFGEMALLENDTRSATITAVSDCILYEISREDFQQLGAENPAIGYAILMRMARGLCARIRKSNRDILKLTTALSIALSR